MPDEDKEDLEATFWPHQSLHEIMALTFPCRLSEGLLFNRGRKECRHSSNSALARWKQFELEQKGKVFILSHLAFEQVELMPCWKEMATV